MALDPQLIKSAVTDEDDFGHEIRVLQALRSIPKCNLEHGGTYTDDVSGKPRQFDFRAEIENSHCIFRLAIECKRLAAQAPLVVCGTKLQKTEASHDLIVSRSSLSGIGKSFTKDPRSFTKRVHDSAYLEGRFAGRSMLRLVQKKESSNGTRLVSAPDSDVYDRWAQALASSVELCHRAAVHNAPIQRQSRPAIFTAVIPMVVIPNGTLWQVEYAEDGTILKDPEPADECAFFVGRRIQIDLSLTHEHSVRISSIHFVTMDGLRTWIEKFSRFAVPRDGEVNLLRHEWFPNDAVEGIP